MASLKDLVGMGVRVMPGEPSERAMMLARKRAALPTSEGGLGLPEENTAKQRAIALGYLTAPSKWIYHATTYPSEIGYVDPSKSDFGFHAGTLSQALRRIQRVTPEGGLELKENPQMYPLMMNKYANFLPVKDEGTFRSHALAKQLYDKGLISKDKLDQVMLDTHTDWLANHKYDEEFRKLLENEGYAGIKYKNTSEGEGTSYAFGTPEGNVRSIKAAFDPFRRGEAGLLASHPLASTGAALAATGGLSGMMRSEMDKPLEFDPLHQFRETAGMELPVKRGDVISQAIGAIPGIGDVYGGIQAIDAASKGKYGEAALDAAGLAGLAGAVNVSHGAQKIKDYIQSLRKEGNYFYDDKKNLAYEKHNMPTGEWWQVHEVYPQEEGGNQFLGGLHRSLEDAISSVKGAKISQALKSNYNKKYGEIPRLWTGFEKKTAKALIDAGFGIDRYSRSSQSKSHYLYLDNGLKIRLSDHKLPSHYDQPDIHFSLNGNIPELLFRVQDLSNNLKNDLNVPIESLVDLLRNK